MMVTEMVLEKNLMEEIADTMPTEGPSIEGSELLEVDEVETSDEEDDISSNTKEINESRPRVVVKRLLVIDLKDEENILDEKVKEMEVSETIGGEKTSAQENESTEESHSNDDPHKEVEDGDKTASHQSELQKADQDEAERQAEVGNTPI